MGLGKILVLFAGIAAVAALALPVLWPILFPLGPIPDHYLADGYFGPADISGGKIPKDNTAIKPFKIAVPDADLEDLKSRLRSTRYGPGFDKSEGFNYGFPAANLKDWIKYWETQYNWKSVEANLNKLPHYKTQIEGLDIHFIHIKPSAETAKGLRDHQKQPLLLLHGWPGSFVEFLKIIPLLTESADSMKPLVFELIIPSLPGYGFSSASARAGCDHAAVARIFKKLMVDRLGHSKYFVQGGDWGAIIAHYMSVLYPENVRGLHLNMPTINMSSKFWLKRLAAYLAPGLVLDNPKEDFSKIFPLWDKVFHTMLEEMGYAHLQGTKPDTLGAGLTDSPAGLAAYILEKFTSWTYRSEKSLAALKPTELTSRQLTKDDILTNIMIYWISGSAMSSVRFYKENMPKLFSSSYDLKNYPATVPAGYADFPGEIVRTPRYFLTDSYTQLIHMSSFKTGGHFAAFEEPKLLAADIRLFVGKVLEHELAPIRL